MRLASAIASTSFSLEVERVEQAGAQGQQVFAELLQFGAFALEVGLAGFVGAFELALELEVEFAAFGHELATDEVAFFGFAGHEADRGRSGPRIADTGGASIIATT